MRQKWYKLAHIKTKIIVCIITIIIKNKCLSSNWCWIMAAPRFSRQFVTHRRGSETDPRLYSLFYIDRMRNPHLKLHRQVPDSQSYPASHVITKQSGRGVGTDHQKNSALELLLLFFFLQEAPIKCYVKELWWCGSRLMASKGLIQSTVAVISEELGPEVDRSTSDVSFMQLWHYCQCQLTEELLQVWLIWLGKSSVLLQMRFPFITVWC